jgi:hypothetical protein
MQGSSSHRISAQHVSWYASSAPSAQRTPPVGLPVPPRPGIRTPSSHNHNYDSIGSDQHDRLAHPTPPLRQQRRSTVMLPILQSCAAVVEAGARAPPPRYRNQFEKHRNSSWRVFAVALRLSSNKSTESRCQPESALSRIHRPRPHWYVSVHPRVVLGQSLKSHVAPEPVTISGLHMALHYVTHQGKAAVPCPCPPRRVPGQLSSRQNWWHRANLS